MCGVAGFAGFHELGLIERMIGRIVHRGPDSKGVAEFHDAAVTLGMRRLAIIDLETGDQPFASSDGRVSLVHNGEIYNFPELRRALQSEGWKFRSQGDTEVILNGFLAWGDRVWDRLRGMFVVALADLRGAEPELTIIRDRLGIKPLYYAQGGRRLAFASEIKALIEVDFVRRAVNLNAIADYLALRYVPGPHTLLEDVRVLGAGHKLRWRPSGLTIDRWWSPPRPVRQASASLEESATRLGAALRGAVANHMISDVPVGAFLSGGIDSNVIAALMAEKSPHPVRAFTIGFPDFESGEATRASLTASAIGARHEIVECRRDDMRFLPDIVSKLDQPIGDPIVVPMYVLAREARREVKVVLSGEGADEILGGYMFHRRLQQMAIARRMIPGPAIGVAAAIVGAISPKLLDLLFDYPGELGASGRDKIRRLLIDLRDRPLGELYRASISLFDLHDSAGALTKRVREAASLSAAPALQEGGSILQRLISAQYADWLPDDILMKTDKMTMAHSLEGRVPFMDHEVVAAAAELPDRHKIGAGANKLALRRFARDLLPKAVTAAPKQAFYLPLESYLEHSPLADIARRTLDPDRTRRRGLFDPDWIARQQALDRSAGFLPHKRLFSIMMLELWFEQFSPDASWN
ncbi:MAG: asparagine synthase (glutamine-hydrolyzing) [Parvularculaceae bacterium]